MINLNHRLFKNIKAFTMAVRFMSNYSAVSVEISGT